MTIEETIELASAEAEDLAVQAAPIDLLMGAADSECGPAVLADLLAHELVACHRLMQRIAAATHGILHYSVPADGAVEGIEGTVDIHCGVAAGQALLGTLFGFAGALYINLRGTFRCFGENSHLVRQDFGKSPGNG